MIAPIIEPIIDPIFEPVIDSMVDLFEDASEALAAGPDLSPARSRAASIGLAPASEYANLTEIESTNPEPEVTQNTTNEIGLGAPKRIPIGVNSDQFDWQAFTRSDQAAWVAGASATIAAG